MIIIKDQISNKIDNYRKILIDNFNTNFLRKKIPKLKISNKIANFDTWENIK